MFFDKLTILFQIPKIAIRLRLINLEFFMIFRLMVIITNNLVDLNCLNESQSLKFVHKHKKLYWIFFMNFINNLNEQQPK